MAYDNLKLEKGLYTCAGGFTKALEAIDPSENYAGTSLESLDAYQRQLKRFDIKVAGFGSDVVEKFFQTSDSAALFPEYVNRSVYQGIMENDVLSKIVATVTNIDSLDYRSIASIPTDDEKELKIVNEGTVIPETNIRVRENLVHLYKRGRMLVASYEAIKLQRLDLFSVTLKQIGAYISRARTNDAIDVLLSGDGNSNPATGLEIAGSALAYSDLLTLWSKFTDYKMTSIIANPAALTSILALSEMRDAYTGLDFHSTGELVTPFGAQMLKADGVADDTIIAFDNTCTLQQVQVGDVQTEFDKLIDRQLERAAITSITGFAKIYDDSCYALDIS